MRLIQFALMLILPMAVFAQPQPDTLWTRYFGGAADEMINALCPSGQGGYLAAGHCGFNGDEMGPQNFYVCNLDSSGNVIWYQEIGLPDTFEMAYGVTAAQNGDVLIAGDDHIVPSGRGPAHLVRLDMFGNVVWDRTYANEFGSLHFARVQEMPGGDLIVAGACLTSDNAPNAYLMRLTSNGDSIWSHTYGDTTQEIITDFLITADGDFLLAGVSDHGANEGDWVRLVRTDADGNLRWMRDHDPGEGEMSASGVRVAELPDGELAFCATRFHAVMDIWLMRVNANGDSVHSGTYLFDEYNSEACDIAAAEDGGVVVAGMSGSYPSYWLEFLKETAGGSLAWHFTLNTNQYSAVLTGILATPDHCYLASGTRWNSANQADGLLIKIGPDIPESSRTPTVGLPPEISISAYPNPFNAIATVFLDLPRAMNARVILYDVTGRQEVVIREQTFEGGDHRITFDAGSLASGLHIVALESDHLLATQKLLLLK